MLPLTGLNEAGQRLFWLRRSCQLRALHGQLFWALSSGVYLGN